MSVLDTYYSCPRPASGASMNGSTLILTSELAYWLSRYYTCADRPLFEGDNDFRRCLKELFPALKVCV